ncbi:YggT family protein [Granulicoccus phenolivorans]|uniref:YggT family protein n=1 Tax=Granulicoccus phenolivorans TaxID=266854 RepID=UPI0004023047|nr:YggT family protein [Granulicoccus phenolivorans]
MALVGTIIYNLLGLYLAILFARMVLSWIPLLVRGWQPRGPVLVICEVIYTITDPPLRLLGKVIPPLRIGNIALDLGFMVLWILILVLQTVVRATMIVPAMA